MPWSGAPEGTTPSMPSHLIALRGSPDFASACAHCTSPLLLPLPLAPSSTGQSFGRRRELVSGELVASRLLPTAAVDASEHQPPVEPLRAASHVPEPHRRRAPEGHRRPCSTPTPFPAAPGPATTAVSCGSPLPFERRRPRPFWPPNGGSRRTAAPSAAFWLAGANSGAGRRRGWPGATPEPLPVGPVGPS